MADSGRGLLLLGVVAILRASCVGPAHIPAAVAGEPIPLQLETLSGQAFRLLPGVGPVLAARLEQARLAAGGTLDEAGARAVHGVGEVLLSRWRALRVVAQSPLR